MILGPKVRQRATAIHLLYLGHRSTEVLYLGHRSTEVAEVRAVSLVTIYKWWHRRWQSNRLEGLVNRARSGRPAKADADTIALLEQTLDVSPLELGFDFPIWKINRLRQHRAEKNGILLSYSRFRALLTSLDYVYRQPKHDLTHLQDSEALERGRELLTWLKKCRRYH